MNKPQLKLPEGVKPRYKQIPQNPHKPQEPRVQLDGHSKRLRDAQKAGKVLTFWMASGVVLEAKVIGFDKYTITIETDVDPQGKALVNRPMILTVYKSAMEGFSELAGS